ncbi:hypothetical protein [Streptococcus sciuri]|uniref:Amino acid permease n=1 Tax=Streptococcus sciuri TaxID=2973939 RepID=A0ABT2F6Y5_9STRE|nr:hypothetical protein [Streptococcus sciuri]MCS4488251.1 hypothetical protein [Streptococcus sciuri]
MASTHIGLLILTMIGLVTNVTITYLAFRNRSLIDDNAPDLSPYSIVSPTLLHVIALVVSSLILGSSFNIISLIMPIISLIIYLS